MQHFSSTNRKYINNYCAFWFDCSSKCGRPHLSRFLLLKHIHGRVSLPKKLKTCKRGLHWMTRAPRFSLWIKILEFARCEDDAQSGKLSVFAELSLGQWPEEMHVQSNFCCRSHYQTKNFDVVHTVGQTEKVCNHTWLKVEFLCYHSNGQGYCVLNDGTMSQFTPNVFWPFRHVCLLRVWRSHYSSQIWQRNCRTETFGGIGLENTHWIYKANCSGVLHLNQANHLGITTSETLHLRQWFVSSKTIWGCA